MLVNFIRHFPHIKCNNDQELSCLSKNESEINTSLKAVYTLLVQSHKNCQNLRLENITYSQVICMKIKLSSGGSMTYHPLKNILYPVRII